MAKLGSKQRPAILRVQSRAAAESVVELCEEHGWHFVLGVEPDKPVDVRDLHALLRRDANLVEGDDSGAMEWFSTIRPDVAMKETRSLIVPVGDHRLPADQYVFEELYCDDAACDCRRVMLKVHSLRDGECLATISHSFDPPAAGDPEDLQTFLDPLHPQSDLADVLQAMFEEILLKDDVYMRRLERHYALVKAEPQVAPRHSRMGVSRKVAPRRAVAGRSKAAGQKLRAGNGERAFLFAPDSEEVIADVDRPRWERAIAQAGGAVAVAAAACGIEGVPRGAKVLWGRSASEAMNTFRRWQTDRKRKS